MTYYIRKTDGSVLTTLTEKELDEQYSMYLVGYPDSVMGGSQGDIRYHDAEIINSNFIKLLENSADNTAPDNPIEGQLWYDKTLKSLKFWNGSSWAEIPASDTGYANQSLDNLNDDGEARFDNKANISLDNLNDDGEARFDNKANISLDNLADSAKNIGNWSTNITNYITEIPQDIKLELNNGILTLKAGSKVYIPNGTGFFDVYTSTSDKTTSYGDINGTFTAFLNQNKNIDIVQTRYAYSGASQPTGIDQYSTWYDTTNNIVKKTGDAGSTWIDGYSLPICIFIVSNNIISSIDQVFNGFGYIGSTIFALPGVKGSISNRHNTDGSLKSIKFTTNKVLTYTETISGNRYIMLSEGNLENFINVFYNKDQNILYNNSNPQILRCPCGTFTRGTNGRISNFQPKTVFHAVDYDDYTRELNNKQDIATAINYSNISNCITYIPQDIKLELNNGTLTLKAGSKVYDGNGLFKEISGDKTKTASQNNQLYVVVDNSEDMVLCFMGDSVASLPSPSTSYKVYYNTTDKKCYVDYGSWYECSFPIALITATTSGITSIDQVFNGFGYIGNKLFTLLGVKGLIPCYWNENGTYKSISFETTEVLVLSDGLEIASKTNEPIRLSGSEITRGALYYNKDLNINTPSSSEPNTFRGFINVGTFSTDANKKITALNVNNPFHAVDYNDREFIGHQAMPSDRYIDLTLGVSGTTYTAPADGYYSLVKVAGNASQNISYNNGTNGMGLVSYPNDDLYCRINVPVSKGQQISFYYSATGATTRFQFIYANGSK